MKKTGKHRAQELIDRHGDRALAVFQNQQIAVTNKRRQAEGRESLAVSLRRRSIRHIEMDVPERPYRLYIWKSTAPRGRCRVYFDRERGRLIDSFARYKDLVSHAQHLATLACYPKSRWMDLYDWNRL